MLKLQFAQKMKRGKGKERKKLFEKLNRKMISDQFLFQLICLYDWIFLRAYLSYYQEIFPDSMLDVGKYYR